MSKTFLLIDYSNLFFRMKYASIKHATTEEKLALCIHNILMGIRSAWYKNPADHCVFALEGHSWRKHIYPEYKRNRETKKLLRSPTEIEEDDLFLETASMFADYIRDNTCCSVVRSKNAEADDVIATWIETHPNDNHIIMSSDSDFHQLIKDNVKIFDPMKQEIYTTNGVFDLWMKPVLDKQTNLQKMFPDPEYVLFKKCIRGDSSDNIKSAYPKIREKSTKNIIGIDKAFADRKSKGYDWNSFMLSEWADHKGDKRLVKEEYEMNKLLIDLSMIPDNIKQEVTEDIQLEASKPMPKHIPFKFSKFCQTYELNAVHDEKQFFMDIFSKKYN